MTTSKKTKEPRFGGKALNLKSVKVDNIRMYDAPDFVDAFIDYAEFQDGTALTDDELDILNEDSDFVYEMVERELY
jgi:hypothetical protein